MKTETSWARFFPAYPRRTVDGKWTSILKSAIWRRKVSGKWQYKQDELTQQEYDDQQWSIGRRKFR